MQPRSRPTRLLLLCALFGALPGPSQAAQPGDEGRCRQQFVQWMLAQQANFSDASANAQVRRQAERRIDQARLAYAQQSSFCAAMAVASHSDNQTTTLAARFGEVQSFDRQR